MLGRRLSKSSAFVCNFNILLLNLDIMLGFIATSSILKEIEVKTIDILISNTVSQNELFLHFVIFIIYFFNL